MPDPDDPYSRLNYRRLIAWSTRIEREWPFLARVLEQAPAASVVDLGCGTGEHARHFAAQGLRAVGLDRAADQIAAARDYEGESGELGPVFLSGAIAELPELTGERFGAAVCLGNVLPHLDDAALAAALEALGRGLLTGGLFVLQVINYERVLDHGIRSLPINFRADPERPGAEIAFVRLMTPDGDRKVRFYPLTLGLRPGADPPVVIEAAREVHLRAWRRAELAAALADHGFEVVSTHGDMTGGRYDAGASSDLVLVARRVNRAGGAD